MAQPSSPLRTARAPPPVASPTGRRPIPPLSAARPGTSHRQLSLARRPISGAALPPPISSPTTAPPIVSPPRAPHPMHAQLRDPARTRCRHPPPPSPPPPSFATTNRIGREVTSFPANELFEPSPPTTATTVSPPAFTNLRHRSEQPPPEPLSPPGQCPHSPSSLSHSLSLMREERELRSVGHQAVFRPPPPPPSSAIPEKSSNAALVARHRRRHETPPPPELLSRMRPRPTSTNVRSSHVYDIHLMYLIDDAFHRASSAFATSSPPERKPPPSPTFAQATGACRASAVVIPPSSPKDHPSPRPTTTDTAYHRPPEPPPSTGDVTASVNHHLRMHLFRSRMPQLTWTRTSTRLDPRGIQTRPDPLQNPIKESPCPLKKRSPGVERGSTLEAKH